VARGADPTSTGSPPCLMMKRHVSRCFIIDCSRLPRAAVWTAGMSREICTPRHDALRKFLKLERQKAELSQADLAQRLGWDQTTVSHIETGAKRVTALELIALGNALDFNPGTVLNRIARIRDE